MEEFFSGLLGIWVFVRDSLAVPTTKGAVFSSFISFGIGLSFSRKIMDYACRKFSNYFIYSLQIPSKDESYSCLQELLFDKSKPESSCNHHIVDTVYKQNNPHDFEIILSPIFGNHFMEYKGKWILYSREQDSVNDIAIGGKAESITLTTLSTRRDSLKQMITDALEYSKLKEKGKLLIYVCSDGSWRKVGRASRPRPLDSIILPKSLKEDIIRDIINFLNNKEWYGSLGIPYRRGYLLYGPPGCGKSSFIKAMAGYFGLSVCLLHLNNKDLTDESFTELLSEAPPDSVLVIEDIDVAFSVRSDTSEINTSGFTLSGLLNALDGIASQEGRLLFMTTNKKEKLDSAFIRPGRVDQHYQFGFALKYQLEELFRNFFPDCSSNQPEEFSCVITENRFSMAEVQKYLITYRGRPAEAISNVRLFEKSDEAINLSIEKCLSIPENSMHT